MLKLTWQSTVIIISREREVGVAFGASSHMLKKIQTCNENKSYCSTGAGTPKLSLFFADKSH